MSSSYARGVGKELRMVRDPRTVKEFRLPSRVKQSFVPECDINNIMKRYEKDGIITHVARYNGEYGAFAGVPEFHDAMNRVIEAEAMFMSLPAAVRSRFRNDPASFIEFATDDKNKDELRKMGLLKPVVPDPLPQKVEVVNPPPVVPDKE